MKAPALPANENERLQALYSYDILDTMAEADFDYLTMIASQICDTPISLITLVDSKRQWFKSAYGVDMRETDKEVSFCAHAINSPHNIMVVPDARTDDRFADNPFVTDEPRIVFYAGVPLVMPGGMALGTLCIIDNKPRRLSDKQYDSLQALSHQVVKLLELRKNNKELLETKEALQQSMDLFTQISQVAQVGGWEIDLLKNTFTWAGVTREIYEMPTNFVPDLRSAIGFFKEGDHRKRALDVFTRAMNNGEPFDEELVIITGRGKERRVRVKAEIKEVDKVYLRVYGMVQVIVGG